MFALRAAATPERAVAVRVASKTATKRGILSCVVGIPLLSVGGAFALIPNDDDEELVERAKANRQTRLNEV
jgi:hypothetical protein